MLRFPPCLPGSGSRPRLRSASQPCSHSWPLAGQVIRVHLGIDNVSQAGNKSQPIHLDVFPGRSGFSGGSSMWVPSAGELLQGRPFLACFFLEVMNSFPFSAIEREECFTWNLISVVPMSNHPSNALQIESFLCYTTSLRIFTAWTRRPRDHLAQPHGWHR